MPNVICHVPLKVRFVGEPTEEAWAALEERLTARFANALRRGLEQHGRRRPGMEPVHEPYDPARESLAGYMIPSYEDTRPTTVPTDTPAVGSDPQGAGSETADQILQRIRDLFPDTQGRPVGEAFCGVFLFGLGGGYPRLFYLMPGPGGDRLVATMLSHIDKTTGKRVVGDLPEGKYQLIVRPGSMGHLYRGAQHYTAVNNPDNLDLAINFFVPPRGDAEGIQTVVVRGQPSPLRLYPRLLGIWRLTDDSQLVTGAKTSYRAPVEIWRGDYLLPWLALPYAFLNFRWVVSRIYMVGGRQTERFILETKDTKTGYLDVTWPEGGDQDEIYEISCTVTLDDRDASKKPVLDTRRDTVQPLLKKMAFDLAGLEKQGTMPGQTPLWARTTGGFLVAYYRQLQAETDPQKAAALRATIARLEQELGGSDGESSRPRAPGEKSIGEQLFNLDERIRAETDPARRAELYQQFSLLERRLHSGVSGPFPIAAIFADRATARSLPIKLFLSLAAQPAADGNQTWRLLDLTYPGSYLTREGTGRTAEAAIRAAFESTRNSFRGNYPPGRILAHVLFPGMEAFGLDPKGFDLGTDTEGTKRTAYEWLSEAAAVTAAVGIALSVVFPPTSVIVGAIVVVGAVAGGTVSAINLIDRITSEENFHWDRQAAADVVNLAASLVIAGGAIARAVSAGALGSRLATVGKALVRPMMIGGIATNFANGIVMNYETWKELDEIDTKASPTEQELKMLYGEEEGGKRWRTDRQVRIFGLLARAAINNAFTLVSIRGEFAELQKGRAAGTGAATEAQPRAGADEHQTTTTRAGADEPQPAVTPKAADEPQPAVTPKAADEPQPAATPKDPAGEPQPAATSKAAAEGQQPGDAAPAAADPHGAATPVGGAAAPTQAKKSALPSDYTVQKVTYKNRPDVVPPPGTALEFPGGERVWRNRSGAIVIESTVGPSIGRRRHTENELPLPGKEMGLTDHERAHAQGQGTGFESPYGIAYAPKEVNQALQNDGIEELLRGLRAELPPDVRLDLITESRFKWGSRRMESITYRIDVSSGGETRRLFEFDIAVKGTSTAPVLEYGSPWTNPDPSAIPFLNTVDVQARVAERAARLRSIISARRAAKP